MLIFRRSVHVIPSHPRRSSTFGVAPIINQDSTEAAATVLHKRAWTDDLNPQQDSMQVCRATISTQAPQAPTLSDCRLHPPPLATPCLLPPGHRSPDNLTATPLHFLSQGKSWPVKGSGKGENREGTHTKAQPFVWQKA